jgi:hypothetical protein
MTGDDRWWCVQTTNVVIEVVLVGKAKAPNYYYRLLNSYLLILPLFIRTKTLGQTNQEAVLTKLIRKLRLILTSFSNE